MYVIRKGADTEKNFMRGSFPQILKAPHLINGALLKLGGALL